MKKILVLLFVSVTAATPLCAQLAQSDAKGQTSIILTNSNVNINISESSLDLKWNNFNQENYRKRKDQYWGIGASGKLEDGIANIWNDGNIATSASIDGFYAWRSPVGKAAQFYDIIDQKKKVREKYSQEDSLFKAYRNLQKIAKQAVQADPTFSLNKDDVSAMVTKIIDLVTTGDTSVIFTQFRAYQSKLAKDGKPLDSVIVSHVRDSIDANWQRSLLYQSATIAMSSELRKLNQRLADLKKANNDKNIRGSFVTWFVHGGMTGTMYELYDTTQTGDLNNRFVKTNFRGGFIDLGFNYEFTPSFILGFAAGYEYANTFDSLDKKDYSVKDNVSGTGQSLSSEKKHTAYTGYYEKYSRVNLKVDAPWYFNISDDYQMVWNTLYMRWYLPINKATVKPVSNWGTSLTFFKQDGKFAGGVYLEQRDVFNRVLDKSFGERLQLGLTATFSFGSIVNRVAATTADSN